MDVLTLLAPIFLVIALGASLQRGGLLPPEVLAGMNRLTYRVGLPVLVYVSLAHAERGNAGGGRLLTVLVVATLTSAGLAWLLSRLMGVPPSGRGTFVQAGFRGNLTFVGLPLILALPGIPRAAAILALAPLLVLYNVLAVVVLLASQHRGGSRIGGVILGEIIRNPIVISSVLGGMAYAFGFRLPAAIDASAVQVSRMAVPLALLCVGAVLMTTPLRGNRRIATSAALFKTVMSPAIGYAVGRVAGLETGALVAVVLLTACPTATISYTMVNQMGGDEGVAASAIVLSTLFSIVALAIALAILGG